MTAPNPCNYADDTCNNACSAKKKHERHTLESFLSLIELEVRNVQCREGPDFIIATVDGSRIGLELAEHLQDGSACSGKVLRSFESRVCRLLDIIESLVAAHPDSSALQHTPTSLCFKQKMLPKGTALSRLAEELISVASVSTRKPGTEIVVTDFDQHPLSTQYVKKVVFQPGHPARFSRWYCGEAMCGCVGLNVKHVKDILESKAAKVHTYRAGAAVSELWLMIFSDNSPYISAFPPLVQEVKQFAHNNSEVLAASGFDQVWFFSFHSAVSMYPTIKSWGSETF